MPLAISLLGPPHIERDGEPVRLGGRKPWALLAYLILEPAGQTRQTLAELLFADAADPLAALRWSLLQARRAVEPAEIIETDGRLMFSSTEGTDIDVLMLQEGVTDLDRVEDVVGGALLEGMSFDESPSFDRWLMNQRARIATANADTIRWAATMVSRTAPARALALVDRGLHADPFDDALHEIAVNVHMSRSDRRAADAYIASVQRTYADELGIDVPESILRPIERAPHLPGAPPVPADVEARMLLEKSQKQIDAADYEPGLDSARRAAASAAASGDRALEARALMVLAGALIHTIHGRDHESHGLLARAQHVATELNDIRLLAEIDQLFGWIALMDARYGAAESALTRSITWATQANEPALAAKARAFRGICALDRADIPRAEADLQAALLDLAGDGDRGFRGFTRGALARLMMHTDRVAEARHGAHTSLDELETGGMHGTTPWALCWIGEAALLDGDRTEARDAFDRSWALAQEFADPCWESLSLRGYALCATAEGRRDEATSLLTEGLARGRRDSDTYRWVEATILTELVESSGGSNSEHLRDAVRLTHSAPMPDLAERLVPFLSEQTPIQTPAG